MRVQYDVMAKEFERVLAKKGFSPEDAKNAAVIFAQNSLAGVYSHNHHGKIEADAENLHRRRRL